MSDDRAGILPKFDVEMGGREYTPTDRKFVQNVLFYLQEIIKLLPPQAKMSLVATWDDKNNIRETINIGTLSNMQVISLMVDVESLKLLEKHKVSGNG